MHDAMVLNLSALAWRAFCRCSDVCMRRRLAMSDVCMQDQFTPSADSLVMLVQRKACSEHFPTPESRVDEWELVLIAFRGS